MYRQSLAGPPRLWDTMREIQIRILKEQGLQPHHILLDVGCGPLRGGVPIIQYLNSNNYYGVDSNKIVVEEGKKELKDYNLESKYPHVIHVEDFKDLKIDETFDFIWGFSVIIHMTDVIYEDFIRFCKRKLKDNGMLLFNVNVGEWNIRSFWRTFPVNVRPFSFYKSVILKNGMVVEEIGTLDSFGYKGSDIENKQKFLKVRLQS